MLLILPWNSPNAGPVTSSVDFLEMETWAAPRRARMLYSLLPPALQICHRDTLESHSPAAWKIHVNPPARLSGKTVLCFMRKTAPSTHIIRLQLSYKAGVVPKHGGVLHGVGHASLRCRADRRAFVYLPSPPLWATPHQ